MESISRDVKGLESEERRLYESVVGHALRENQRVIIHVIEVEDEPDEAVRRKAMDEFHELAKEGTAHREQQCITVEEADQIVDEAVRETRSRKSE